MESEENSIIDLLVEEDAYLDEEYKLLHYSSSARNTVDNYDDEPFTYINVRQESQD